MDEIGRQAGIFANADRGLYGVKYHDMMRHGSFRGSKSDDDFDKRLAGIHETVEVIFGDWWFSSLWTLQESVLRQDDFLLCREGILLKELVDLAEPESPEPPTGLTPGYKEDPTEGPRTLSYLEEMILGLYTQLALSRAFRAVQSQGLRDATLKHLQETGYTSPPSSNLNVQYAAARHRKTLREEDRIDGKMALYGIKVGAAAPGADSKRKHTFIEVENEFVSALNAESPLLGQMFVHTKQPLPGKTWQIAQSSRIPLGSLSHYINHYPMENCSIFASPRGGNLALLGGDITPMRQLFNYWKAYEGPDPTPPGGFEALWFELKLDDYLPQEHPSIPRPDSHLGAKWDDSHYLLNITYRTVIALMDVFAVEQLSVLRLGTSQYSRQPQLLYGLVLLHESNN